MRKINYEECMELIQRHGRLPAHTNCFIISGSKVHEGVGRYVVIAVGTKSFHGRIMAVLQSDPETTPLQLKLDKLAELITQICLISGFILFSALMIRFFVQLGQNNPVRTDNEKGITFINILILSATLIVVAVPRGLLLNNLLALAFTTRRMIDENILVRSLKAFESMENVLVFCTTNTGTITQNMMTVVAGSIGVHAKFHHRGFCHNVDEDNQSLDSLSEVAAKDIGPSGFDVSHDKLVDAVPPVLCDLLSEAIQVNSPAYENYETGDLMYAENQTGAALLQFAKDLRYTGSKAIPDVAYRIRKVPFSRKHNAMCAVIRLPDGTGYRAYFKGPADILLKKSTNHVSASSQISADVETRPIKELEEANLSRTITSFSKQAFRTIAICYKDLEEWPPMDVTYDGAEHSNLAQNLTLIAIIAIQDQLRPGVKEMVERCHYAGVAVTLVTGDNLLTARSLAEQCGVLRNGLDMEGSKFSECTAQELLDKAPRLQVLARSSPDDMGILVRALERFGQVVLVTAKRSVLKTGKVDLSMSITGTEVTKELSDVTVMDDNFTSIVKVIAWSRCFNDAVRKLLQFQISIIVTVVVITLVSAMASIQASSVLSPVQLLWIYLIMDPFAALALLTDRPSKTLLDKRPSEKTRPLLTTDMYKQIVFQSVYQIAFMLTFHFLGFRILGREFSDNTQQKNRTVQTLVFKFNAFVFAQVFNSINCRGLDRKLNVFEGILKNGYFLAITLIEIGVQTLIIFVGGDAFQVRTITGRDWGISLALGVVPIPLGVLIRVLPNEPFEKVLKKLGLLDKSETLPTVDPECTAQSNAENIEMRRF